MHLWKTAALFFSKKYSKMIDTEGRSVLFYTRKLQYDSCRDRLVMIWYDYDYGDDYEHLLRKSLVWGDERRDLRIYMIIVLKAMDHYTCFFPHFSLSHSYHVFIPIWLCFPSWFSATSFHPSISLQLQKWNGIEGMSELRIYKIPIAINVNLIGI